MITLWFRFHHLHHYTNIKKSPLEMSWFNSFWQFWWHFFFQNTHISMYWSILVNTITTNQTNSVRWAQCHHTHTRKWSRKYTLIRALTFQYIILYTVFVCSSRRKWIDTFSFIPYLFTLFTLIQYWLNVPTLSATNRSQPFNFDIDIGNQENTSRH